MTDRVVELVEVVTAAGCKLCGERLSDTETVGAAHRFCRPCRQKIWGRSSTADGYWKAPIPAEPTCARPGSAEKLAILEARADSKRSLWHPNDAPADPEVEARAC